jgi:hypothetical protein
LFVLLFAIPAGDLRLSLSLRLQLIVLFFVIRRDLQLQLRLWLSFCEAALNKSRAREK